MIDPHRVTPGLPEAYADGAPARHVAALLDHLGLDRVVVIGYSMGRGSRWSWRRTTRG